MTFACESWELQQHEVEHTHRTCSTPKPQHCMPSVSSIAASVQGLLPTIDWSRGIGTSSFSSPLSRGAEGCGAYIIWRTRSTVRSHTSSSGGCGGGGGGG